jgi:hypothetical protein
MWQTLSHNQVFQKHPLAHPNAVQVIQEVQEVQEVKEADLDLREDKVAWALVVQDKCK